ncbi:hypothetical protein BDF20DRAFT_855727 [Mycotypha africana]|uniref:uncharacterized protein n=1 Tax=Mycotypha africana TaxID=64632 RepID=UPI0023019C7E|nr:uncharacterized protein BDF20DRAFT_855727 [Mycotypha africana]KAI8988447.1 hypothetical protein BDF20DRAFT_855727 [Mycotypha africana]
MTTLDLILGYWEMADSYYIFNNGLPRDKIYKLFTDVCMDDVLTIANVASFKFNGCLY